MDDQKTADQLKADAFMEEFVGQLARDCGSDIDFILLFGSAARGEFILGKSDVDLVIQTKTDEGAGRVERLANALFWRLDEKHGMQFKRVVSTGERGAACWRMLSKGWRSRPGSTSPSRSSARVISTGGRGRSGGWTSFPARSSSPAIQSRAWVHRRPRTMASPPGIKGDSGGDLAVADVLADACRAIRRRAAAQRM